MSDGHQLYPQALPASIPLGILIAELAVQIFLK